MIRSLVTIGVVLLLTAPARTQEQAVTIADTLETPAPAGGVKFLPLPIFFYTPETGFAGGAAVLMVERVSDSHQRPSSLVVDVIYTQKKQIIAEAYPSLHLGGGSYHLMASIAFSRYPQRFYGIGGSTPDDAEELYTSKSTRIGVDALCRIWDGIDAGATVYFESRRFADLKAGGRISTGSVPGAGGGTIMGLGVIARWDTRDNEFAPLTGRFYQVTWRSAAPSLGSDYTFSHLNIDLREYLRTTETSVIGLQLLTTAIYGKAPFYLLARLGGSSSMRGYYEGRYRDNILVAGQAEYRFPVFWRFRGSAFLGLGDVAPSVSSLTLRTAKPSYGFGLRYLFDPSARLHIRFDMGFGNDASGVYMTVHEAF